MANGASMEISDIEKADDQISLDKTQPDDGFVSDWTEGNENIYGYGSVYNGTVEQLSTNDDYRFVVQDGWVYYFWIENGIYKMPVNAADGGQVFKLAPLNGWIYDLSVMKDWLYYYENDQLMRLRTDGMVQEVLHLQSEEVRETDGYYLAHDQFYYVSKTRRSYTVDKRYARIDLEGNILAEYDHCLPQYLWDENKELFIGEIGENRYAGDNLGYIWLNGETQRDTALSDLEFNAENYYVCAELDKVVYSVKESERTVYCTDIETFDTVRLNSDWTEVFYSWGDGYIYYPTSVDKDGRGVRTFCRIKPDGSAWEDVSWMFY